MERENLLRILDSAFKLVVKAKEARVDVEDLYLYEDAILARNAAKCGDLAQMWEHICCLVAIFKELDIKILQGAFYIIAPEIYASYKKAQTSVRPINAWAYGQLFACFSKTELTPPDESEQKDTGVSQMPLIHQRRGPVFVDYQNKDGSRGGVVYGPDDEQDDIPF